MKRPLIVCCAPGFGEAWRTLGPGLTGDAVEWVFYDDRPINALERKVPRPNIAMLRAAFCAVTRASRGNAKLLITHDPRASFLCALFCRLLGIRVDHYVDSFNFAELPGGYRQKMMRFAFRQLKEIAVHSSMERGLYSKYFDIPESRIRLRLWSIGIPQAYPAHPLMPGRYISSIGGNGRDYRTLLEASKLLPEIPLVVVVRPESLVGLEIPPNVTVKVNAPFGEAMNLLQHSEFMVLPLSGSTVPCGHVTLVCAMHLGKATVATDSKGITDYLIPGYNGVVCEPSSAESLAHQIAALWAAPAEAARLGENNRRFGAENCSELRMRSDLAGVLAEWDIPLMPDAIRTTPSS